MKINGLRWWVIFLIALATVINYIDRQCIGVLWPDIADDLFPDLEDGPKQSKRHHPHDQDEAVDDRFTATTN